MGEGSGKNERPPLPVWDSLQEARQAIWSAEGEELQRLHGLLLLDAVLALQQIAASFQPRQPIPIILPSRGGRQ